MRIEKLRICQKMLALEMKLILPNKQDLYFGRSMTERHKLGKHRVVRVTSGMAHAIIAIVKLDDEFSKI